ncbi:MAG: GDP-mannose-dependent alpha-mannosyltransferase [Syntrophorhabdus sp. PtaB.Bin047]|jgi:glycosyltransferase involved in cell wall biosynthesis|nr:MAG: GDP-mannose-dependent alpha-mannosyltransferase [Syntrophorhabdus sp. PtaB.Bin047]
MRILLLVVYYLPSTMSSAKLMHDLAVEFRRQGHEPVVMAPDENIGSDCEVSVEDGIEVVRVRTGRIKSASRMLRAINEIRLSGTLWARGREYLDKKGVDLVVYYSPTIFFGGLVARLRSTYGCSSYLVLRDIFPKWALDAGVMREGLIYRYFRRKEIEQYDAADVIGVQSPANLSYFAEDPVLRSRRVEVLYNWTALEEKGIPVSHYREELGLKGKVVFFYGGNIGVAQDVDNIVKLAQGLRNEEEAHFLFVGDGSESGRLRSMISELGLSNMTLHGSVAQDEYLAMLSEFDVGLISLDGRLKTQNFPGKMLGYMYHSLPILASINPGNDLKGILERHGAGLVSVNGEDEVLRDNAIRLLRDDGLRRRMGLNGRRLLNETFSVEAAAGQILGHFSGHHSGTERSFIE